MRRLQLRDLAPRSEIRGSYVFPICSAIVRNVDETIVSSSPDYLGIPRRGCYRINHATMLPFHWIRLDKHTQSRRHARIFASQVRTHDLPAISTVGRSEQHIRT